MRQGAEQRIKVLLDDGVKVNCVKFDDLDKALSGQSGTF
jgi:hypothetical protein